jgi:heat-inducible transcriptional repressor
LNYGDIMSDDHHEHHCCHNEIDERAQEILRQLVECYIREGQPVGSKTLAQVTQLNISSASIRNIMADLEAAGFLQSPHTSAGRVPTVKGYRFFVDGLLNVRSPCGHGNDGDEGCLGCGWGEQLRGCTDTKELITTASTMLVDMTHLASVVMLPRRETAVLRQIEFLPLSENRVLIILVLHKHEVQNRIICTDRPYSRSELQNISNYLTANFVGKELHEIRQLLVAGMRHDQSEIAQLTRAITEITDQMLAAESSIGVREVVGDYVVTGATNLFDISGEQHRIEQLRGIFDALAAKRDVLHLLDRCLHADGIRIYIGEESGYAPFGECSLVATPYREGNKIIGVLGVIGPTRMAYDKAMAAVDVTAKLLSAALAELG